MAEVEKEFLITELGKNIRLLRKQKGLSQAELAKKAGTTQLSVTRLETAAVGDTHIGLLLSIANTLEVRLDELLQGCLLDLGGELKQDRKWYDLGKRLAIASKEDRENLYMVIDVFLKMMGRHA